jgi:hypothetical protein
MAARIERDDVGELVTETLQVVVQISDDVPLVRSARVVAHPFKSFDLFWQRGGSRGSDEHPLVGNWIANPAI